MSARLTSVAAAIAFAVCAAPAAAAPEAGFGWSPSAPQTGETVTFTATTTPESASNYWELTGRCDTANPDSWVAGRVVTRAYERPGEYRICLAARDSEGDWDFVARTITIANRAPTAAFGFEPAAPAAGETVRFTSSSSDPDGTLTEAWDLDNDGEFDDATGPAAERAFDAGPHTVGLQVTDDRGASATAFTTVEVAPAPASAPPPESPGEAPQGGESPAGGELAGTQGAAPLAWLAPWPTVRIAGVTSRRGARLTIFSIQAPQGSRVLVRCAGRSCPFKKRALVVGKAQRVRVKRLQRHFRRGTRISVRVTRAGVVGKFTRFRIRAVKAPVRWEGCVMPGASKAVDCPAR